MTTFIKVQDTMGQVRIPADALYGAQTQRAVNNFPVSGLRMPRRFIQALGLIKFCCAEVNYNLGRLDKGRAGAIKRAATKVARGDYDAQFPVDVFQTGSGTSSNMNANEVISHLAGSRTRKVHPNDHINMSQSSNDVIPTAIRVSAALAIDSQLLPTLGHLADTIDRKGGRHGKEIKTGRTHLMDAMPIRVEQELSGWSYQIRTVSEAIRDSLKRLSALPQGGTAVGTGINSPPGFGKAFCAALSDKSGFPFTSMKNYYAGLSAQDAAVEMSGQLRVLAVALMKISNDLRWMNSGPLAGLGEIELPVLQPGSSIMPGKVNPVIPEAVTMVSAQVMGNDATIAVAGQSGNFQLNVMLPLIAYNLLQSIEISANAARLLADKAIKEFKFRAARTEEVLTRNPILVTALNQVIGYEKGAAIAKKAYKENRPIIEVAQEMTDMSKEELSRHLDPARLTDGK